MRSRFTMVGSTSLDVLEPESLFKIFFVCLYFFSICLYLVRVKFHFCLVFFSTQPFFFNGNISFEAMQLTESSVAEIDLVPLSVTLFSCLIFGLEYGVIAGIAVNLVLLLYVSARPRLTIEEQTIDGLPILFVEPKQSLSFPAAEYLRERVMLW